MSMQKKHKFHASLVWLWSFLLMSLVAIRGFHLEQAPQGFYLDEAAIAAQSICIAESGRAADHSIRLFAPVLGGGYATPVTLGLSAAWIKVSGHQIASFRVLAALVGLIGLAAIGWAARLWHGRPLTWPIAGALLLTSPWIFHLSRIYWDPIFAFSLWCLTLVSWAAWRIQPDWKNASAIGFFAALSMLTYPPFRIGIPLAVLVMLWPSRAMPEPRLTRQSFISLCAGGCVGLMPLLTVIQDEGFWSRGDFLAIWNSKYLTQTQSQPWNLPFIFLENLGRHFDPQFLLFRGDENLRHSTGFGGLIQPAEVLGIVALFVFTIRHWPRPEGRILLIAMIGFFPAALTWEAIPHALRGLMAAPSLLLAAILGAELIMEKWRRHQIGLLVLSLAIAGFFVPYALDYFGRYSQDSRLWYEADTISHWRKTGEWLKPREDLAHLYFKLSEDLESCGAETKKDRIN